MLTWHFSLSFAEFVGGIPKPQHLERTRVLSVGGSHRYNKNHGHHRHEASKQHESSKLEKDAQLLNNETFKLWEDGPNFDTNLRQNVVALVGRTAYLTCRVFDRGNKTVTIFIGSSSRYTTVFTFRVFLCMQS